MDINELAIARLSALTSAAVKAALVIEKSGISESNTNLARITIDKALTKVNKVIDEMYPE